MRSMQSAKTVHLEQEISKTGLGDGDCPDSLVRVPTALAQGKVPACSSTGVRHDLGLCKDKDEENVPASADTKGLPF